MGRLDPILSEIQAITKDLKDPAAKSRRLATFAREEIARVKTHNAAVLGRDVPHEVTVDGMKGAPLNAVRPDGVIIADFDLMRDLLEWIGAELIRAAPILTGAFQRSIIMLADGLQVHLGEPIPDANEYAFLSPLPYARKIERGQSHQAPEGVFEVLAALANRRFGNTAYIRFRYREVAGLQRVGARTKREDTKDRRVPAIIVRPY